MAYSKYEDVLLKKIAIFSYGLTFANQCLCQVLNVLLFKRVLKTVLYEVDSANLFICFFLN